MENVKVLWINTTDPRGAVGIVKATDHIVKFQNDEQADNENPMEKITEEAMEILCDKYCKYSDTVKDQDELEQICDKCRVGQLIGIDAVNEYNRMKEVGADETD